MNSFDLTILFLATLFLGPLILYENHLFYLTDMHITQKTPKYF